MAVGAYRQVWAIPAIRNVQLVGILSRIPQFGSIVVLTLHVVQHLDSRYSAAGFVAMVSSIAMAIASPWRGRLLDRVGLRRTVLPSLIISPIVWVVAPFLSYWPLLVLALVASIFGFPSFSIMRQVMLANAPLALRRPALALDSVIVELCFMLGPLLGVLAATTWDTRVALISFNLLATLGNLAIYVLNPPITHHDDDHESHATHDARGWLSLPAVGVFAAVFGAGFILAGTDVGVVAALRAMNDPVAIGWVMSLWSIGSAVGGFAYGALHRPISVPVLTALLGLTTAPVALAQTPLGVGLVLVVAGLFCAPTIAATVDALSSLVPSRYRGEVMGWHGSVVTAGTSMSPPIVGWIMDVNGWRDGFLWAGGVGFAMAVLVAIGLYATRKRELIDT